MRSAFCLFFSTTLLSACISTGAITSKAIDYNSAAEQIDNQLLVLNILRARDHQPLHFGDVSSIHGSLQLTSSITPTVLFGPIHQGSGSHTLASTASFQDSPSFDMSNLDTQDFITGIMSPISPKVVKYWADRGLDTRMIMLVFFSSVEITIDNKVGGVGNDAKMSKNKSTLILQNSPRPYLLSAMQSEQPDCVQDSDKAYHCYLAGQPISAQKVWPFFAYLSIINRLEAPLNNKTDNENISGIVFKAVPDLTSIGPAFELNKISIVEQLKAIGHIDPDKYEFDHVNEKGDSCDDVDPACTFFQLNAVGQNTNLVMCYDLKQQGAQVMARLPQLTVASQISVPARKQPSACNDLTIQQPPSSSSAKNSPTPDCNITAEQWLTRLQQYKYDPRKKIPDECAPAVSLNFRLRSTGDIIHFLGDLLYLQSSPPPDPSVVATREQNNIIYNESKIYPVIHHNAKVTLGYCSATETSNSCSDGGILFDLNRNNYEDKNNYGRIHVSYVEAAPDGKPTYNSYYSVPEATEADNSMQVLAILTQLVGLNRSAKDLIKTPTVQVVP